MAVVTQGYTRVISSAQVDVPPTTGVKLNTLITVDIHAGGLSICNNDASATIYISYGTTVTTTNYDRILVPGSPPWEEVCGQGFINQIHILSSSGTVKARVSQLGQ